MQFYDQAEVNVENISAGTSTFLPFAAVADDNLASFPTK